MGDSGGIITYNFREGYRSEKLAEYVFSAFGPCSPFKREDDFGIDLFCNLSDKEGKMMTIKSAYGVQVKSIDTKFEFKGKQATAWLLQLEYPLLLADVDKENSTINIYSTANVNRLLMQLTPDAQDRFPETISFITDKLDKALGDPDPKTGIVPIGKPILSFNIMDLGDKTKRLQYWDVLDEWVRMDSENYRLRLAGVTTSFVYKTWGTNKTLQMEGRNTWNEAFYSLRSYQSTKKFIAKAAVVTGLSLKETYRYDKGVKEEFNHLRKYIMEYCNKELRDTGWNVFEEELE